MKELISVVVPVYKAEKYLDKCISSIAEQTYRNLEIILVDDGSPDDCPAICDRWAQRDKRIKVIHCENGGGARARNIGIDASRGEIIAFVDSDDYIAHDMYEYLHSLMDEDVDVSECAILLTDGDGAEFDSASDSKETVICSSCEAMRHHINDSIFRQTPPNKIYRRSALGDIRFTEGKRIDDEFFTYRVIGASRRLVHSRRRLYAYRQQEGSVMHAGFSPFRLQAVEAKLLRLRYVEERYPELLSVARVNLINTCMYLGQMSLLYLEKDAIKDAFSKLDQAVRECGASLADIKNENSKQKLWFLLSRISLRGCCRLRNLIKIGM